jgi:AcrR family transcriptional regulator
MIPPEAMIDEARRKTTARKTAKKRPPRRELVRGEPVVQAVLEATLAELARAGYKALRMEDVALSAGVNKTTVYRRWPEKAALVREALSTIAHDVIAAPDTGSLRGDLIALGCRMVELCGSCQGQSVIRMLVSEGYDPEVADLKRAMRKQHEAVPRAIMSAAVARGELAADRNHLELFEAFMGAIHHKMFFMNERVDATFVERLADLLLHGALKRPAQTV